MNEPSLWSTVCGDPECPPISHVINRITPGSRDGKRGEPSVTSSPRPDQRGAEELDPLWSTGWKEEITMNVMLGN